MAIPRRWITSSNNQEMQWLKVDHSTRFVQNYTEEWQTVFGPNSVLSTSKQEVKLAARFNDATFNNIQMTAYLYDDTNGTIASSSSCVFNLYKVTAPDWTEVFITALNGTILPSSYFYANPTVSSLGLDFQGGDTLMIEAAVTRLGIVYRDRVYVNHLGIFDNITRLRQDVEFLEITKKDL